MAYINISPLQSFRQAVGATTSHAILPPSPFSSPSSSCLCSFSMLVPLQVLPVEAGVRDAAALAQKLAAAAAATQSQTQTPNAGAATPPAEGSAAPAAAATPGTGGGGGKSKAAAQAAASAASAAAKAAAAAAAASARLEPGQYKSIADALAAAEAGDTVVLGPGHHWEVKLGAGADEMSHISRTIRRVSRAGVDEFSVFEVCCRRSHPPLLLSAKVSTAHRVRVLLCFFFVALVGVYAPVTTAPIPTPPQYKQSS